MPRMHPYIIVVVLLLMACSAKKEQSGIPSELLDEVRLQAGNPEEGKLLYATCAGCHGEGGQGMEKMQAPALVNVDRLYLYRQVMNFSKGIRGYADQDTLGKQMALMAKTLKDSIAVNHVVTYIKTLPEVSLSATIIGDIRKGERIYQSICGSCHGPEGKGNEMMHAPRLNGLNDWYLKRQITNFKGSLRGGHPGDKLGAQMLPMAASLTDEQAINDVIAYIQSAAKPVTQ